MLNNLYQTILKRKETMPERSYTARLFTEGEDEIVKKVGEETIEVILAAKAQGKQRLIEEIADLTYHLLVLMVEKGVTPEDITAELEQRKR